MSDNEVKIDWNKNWWQTQDMSSRLGRIKYWFGVADPLKSFITDSTVLSYNKELKQHAQEAPMGIR